MAAQLGNHVAILAGDAHVIEAAAPLARALRRLGGQPFAAPSGTQEGDGAMLRHRRVAMAVAGESKGGVASAKMKPP